MTNEQGAIIKEIIRVWEKFPCLRLCQILGNLYPAGDLYYKIDEEILKKLKEKYK